uniref:Uncharacterized protein n=1 Tax=Oryza glumipatula TaxID=40148 RepID=A0A0D9Y6U6_9ORYZ
MEIMCVSVYWRCPDPIPVYPVLQDYGPSSVWWIPVNGRGFRSGRGPIIGSHALCVRPIREGFLGVEEDEDRRPGPRKEDDADREDLTWLRPNIYTRATCRPYHKIGHAFLPPTGHLRQDRANQKPKASETGTCVERSRCPDTLKRLSDGQSNIGHEYPRQTEPLEYLRIAVVPAVRGQACCSVAGWMWDAPGLPEIQWGVKPVPILVYAPRDMHRNFT